MTSDAIYGCSGHKLTAEERAFFAETKPWGFILFRRNVDSPAQVKALVEELRDSVGRADAPVLIDQEGGRVQRLGPPHWPKYPPGSAYLKAVNDPMAARELVRLGARLIAHDLRELGITVDCVPVLDVPVPGAHDIIGDRAYAQDPATVTQLGRAAAEGLLAGGVLPIIKHIPGHGRAFSDSHHDLPVVETDLETLDAWDFAPFKALSDMPMAMTAHVVFTAVDAKRPATTSKKGIRLMREHLGFSGLIMSDDLSMKALSGTLTERAEQSLKAGCDVILHCNGDLDEMRQVAQGTGKLKGEAKRRAEASLARIVHAVEPLDVAEARARLEAALSGRFEAAKGPDVGEAQA
ncbi:MULTISPECIES: beta-N-acetylhexosaminidase [unclassified Brevundimonas]|uniref:beta-N-acetylhexosaminidase n=1 Tax=unclassified Brevundimonas TaxID=2622653 RepID=UPI000CFBDC2A|nr:MULTISPECIES: beta-N-acetylhexosaminidase [unclassified Brevundimonas]PRA30416.1 beta-N-acetylhexosaminidase [Brevundimonas sp. MYb27]PQZ83306.1 beta-N-acetylhexosaminidase [Brevundimonas sp. MYb31]PRB16161.1 beta-N-acetylhexosaminidase [Brevundimonas sp. MYb52]PRB35228.1 beta-N-acetylhexosaminidase [Brevundimonas sp. MYb46]PRB46123.1 beta-N-acetylhexosaminidase [Brevundimonas sp. MYb33]